MVVAALRDGGGRARARDALRVCCVCHDPIGSRVGYLDCDPPVANATVHALCPECADGHVLASLAAPGFDGRLRCPCRPVAAGACAAPAYAADEVARVVSRGTFERFHRATVAMHERAVARELERDVERRVAGRLEALRLDARDRAVLEDVRHIEDRIEHRPLTTVYKPFPEYGTVNTDH